ncbi:gluconokinase [Pseudomonas lopnurensis]|uniref:gluconokinase n=1 Tax=Pseudomonas lopnurensis TaxID=1477517 RepID=UPI0018796124|nr:gluconokinase [Pseudomonas lopnurensis]MBE7376169.1 gluconokinase [Pseudomonas lopnurensis]
MIVLVMGVSGSGKTTIGELLASRLGCGFSDADEFHGAQNKAKMASGIALTDADRAPWLRAMHEAILARQRRGEDHVFACSALKRGYRDLLHENVADLRLVYLHGSPELLAERVGGRRGHFFAPQLLQDQLDTLEPPSAEEALIVDIRQTPEAIVEQLVRALAGG